MLDRCVHASPRVRFAMLLDEAEAEARAIAGQVADASKESPNWYQSGRVSAIGVRDVAMSDYGIMLDRDMKAQIEDIYRNEVALALSRAGMANVVIRHSKHINNQNDIGIEYTCRRQERWEEELFGRTA